MELRIPPATIGLLCLANLSEVLLGLALLVDWIRNWRHVKAYWAWGVGAAGAVLAAGILQVALVALAGLPNWRSSLPPGLTGSAAPTEEQALILLLAGLLLMALGLLGIAIAVSRVAGYTMLGLHHAASLGHPGSRLLQRRSVPATALDDKVLPDLGADALWPAEGAAPPAPGHCPARDYALSTLAVGVAYSVLLFRLTSPRIAEVLTILPSYSADTARALTPAVVVAMLSAALSEELIYRLGIQGFLARHLGSRGGRYWLPVVLTSLLWTMQHAGVMEPGWVKLAQIFPFGLLLGWLYRRHGVESCILAHALFNILLAPLSSFLIGM